MPDINSLSPTAKRWMDFFGLNSAEDVWTALRTRIISPGRRPGLTMAVVEELTKWAMPTPADSGPLPTPTRRTEIVTYFQCDDPEHRHPLFDEAQHCMVAGRSRSGGPSQRLPIESQS